MHGLSGLGYPFTQVPEKPVNLREVFIHRGEQFFHEANHAERRQRRLS